MVSDAGSMTTRCGAWPWMAKTRLPSDDATMPRAPPAAGTLPIIFRVFRSTTLMNSWPDWFETYALLASGSTRDPVPGTLRCR